MSVQVYSDHTLQLPPREGSIKALPIGEDTTLQTAESLRQRSRDLRAASESLRIRNSQIMLHAYEVAVRFGWIDPVG